MIVIITSASAAIDSAAAATAAEVAAKAAAEATLDAAAEAAETPSGAGRFSPVLPPPSAPSSPPGTVKTNPTTPTCGPAEALPFGVLGREEGESATGVPALSTGSVSALEVSMPVASTSLSEARASSWPQLTPSSERGSSAAMGAAVDSTESFPTEEEPPLSATAALPPAVTRVETSHPTVSVASVTAAVTAAMKPPALHATAATTSDPPLAMESKASSRIVADLEGITQALSERSATPSLAGGAGRIGSVPPMATPTPASVKKSSVLDEDTRELVGRAFNGGLSQALVQTLTVVAERAPALQPALQARKGAEKHETHAQELRDVFVILV